MILFVTPASALVCTGSQLTLVSPSDPAGNTNQLLLEHGPRRQFRNHLLPQCFLRGLRSHRHHPHSVKGDWAKYRLLIGLDSSHSLQSCSRMGRGFLISWINDRDENLARSAVGGGFSSPILSRLRNSYCHYHVYSSNFWAAFPIVFAGRLEGQADPWKCACKYVYWVRLGILTTSKFAYRKSWTLMETTALPLDTAVISVRSSGASLWVQTVQVETRHTESSLKSYFKKVNVREIKSLFDDWEWALSLKKEK